MYSKRRLNGIPDRIYIFARYGAVIVPYRAKCLFQFMFVPIRIHWMQHADRHFRKTPADGDFPSPDNTVSGTM